MGGQELVPCSSPTACHADRARWQAASQSSHPSLPCLTVLLLHLVELPEVGEPHCSRSVFGMGAPRRGARCARRVL